MLSTWDSTFCIIQLLKSQDHHLSLTTIDGLSSWVAASQVGEIRYAAWLHENGETKSSLSFKNLQPPVTCSPGDLHSPVTKMDLAENSSKNSRPLPPAQQLFAVLHRALAEGLRCDPGFHGNIHGYQWEHETKWCVSSMLGRWMGKSLGRKRGIRWMVRGLGWNGCEI